MKKSKMARVKPSNKKGVRRLKKKKITIKEAFFQQLDEIAEGARKCQRISQRTMRTHVG